MQIKYWLVLFTITFISFGFSIFHNGIFWDDYTIVNVLPKLVMMNFIECGRPQLGYFHAVYSNLSFPVHAYKLTIFLCHIITVLLTYLSLKKLDFLKKNQLYLLILVFSIIPINQTRDSVVLSQYSVSIMLLVLAIYIWLKKHYSSFSLYYKGLITLLLLISFTIEASAALFAFIFPLILYHQSKRLKKSFKSLATSNILLILIPYLYILFTLLYLKPFNSCAGNNAINLQNIYDVPFSVLAGIASSTIYNSLLALKETDSLLLLIPGLVATILVFLVRKMWILDKPKSDKNLLLITAIALGLILAGVIPYSLVGKDPKFYDWFQRFQSHIGIGISFLVLTFFLLLRSFNQQKLFVFTFGLTVFLFVTTNFEMRLIYYRDSLKQKALIHMFRKDQTIKNNHIFTIDDQSLRYNALKRTYRFYEYTGLMKIAFGNESRLVFNLSSNRNEISKYLYTDYPGLFNINDLPKNLSTLPKFYITIHAREHISLTESFLYLLGINHERLEKKIKNWFILNITRHK